jgi:hypothetical protein
MGTYMNPEIPLLKRARFTEKMTFCVDPDTKKKLMQMKVSHGIDVAEWFRRVLNQEIEKLEAACKEASA